MGLILETPPVVMELAGGYDLTCGEIGNELGLTRNVIKRELENLVELGFVNTKKGTGWRKTNLTQSYLDLIM